MSEVKPKSIGVIILIAFVICLIFSANAWKSNLIVKQIRIDGNRIVGKNEIIQLTQLQAGTFLYKADLTAIQRNVMSHHYIKDAVVERNLPNSINIKIIERIPIAMLSRSETLYLDEDGVVLPRTVSRKLFDLPIISGVPANEPLNLGSTIEQEDARESLRLLSVMKILNRPLYHSISEIQIRNGGDIILYSAECSVPIIYGRGDIPNKLVLLETFWSDIVRTRGQQNLQYVDLRYKDQIVTKWNTEPSASKALKADS